MSILGNLLGMSQRRSFGGSMWNRGYGRGRTSMSSGYGRGRIPHFFGGSAHRMAMGGIAAMLARTFLNRRYRSY